MKIMSLEIFPANFYINLHAKCKIADKNAFAIEKTLKYIKKIVSLMLSELCIRNRQIWQADPDLSARSKGISAAKLVLFFLDLILNTVLLMLPYSGCGEMALSKSRSATTYARGNPHTPARPTCPYISIYELSLRVIHKY